MTPEKPGRPVAGLEVNCAWTRVLLTDRADGLVSVPPEDLSLSVTVSVKGQPKAPPGVRAGRESPSVLLARSQSRGVAREGRARPAAHDGDHRHPCARAREARQANRSSREPTARVKRSLG